MSMKTNPKRPELVHLCIHLQEHVVAIEVQPLIAIL